MDELLEALDADFEGKEMLRQRGLNTPEYGNNDLYADSISLNIEEVMMRMLDMFINYYGERPEIL